MAPRRSRRGRHGDRRPEVRWRRRSRTARPAAGPASISRGQGAPGVAFLDPKRNRRRNAPHDPQEAYRRELEDEQDLDGRRGARPRIAVALGSQFSRRCRRLPPVHGPGGVAAAIEGSVVKLGAQRLHFEGSGAFTGESRPPCSRAFRDARHPGPQRAQVALRRDRRAREQEGPRGAQEPARPSSASARAWPSARPARRSRSSRRRPRGRSRA